MVVNGRDSAAQIRQLQLDNKQLRSQLESQYNQIIKMAETIQMVHLARIKDSVRDGDVSAFKDDLDSTTKTLESQQSSSARSRIPAADQAEQLRALEDRARKWAKRYLHKIKAAASRAEQAAGIHTATSVQSRTSSVSGRPSDPPSRSSIPSVRERRTPTEKPTAISYERFPTRPSEPYSHNVAALASIESQSTAPTATSPTSAPQQNHATTAPPASSPHLNGHAVNGSRPKYASAPGGVERAVAVADGVAEGYQLGSRAVESSPGLTSGRGSLHAANIRTNEIFHSADTQGSDEALQPYASDSSRLSNGEGRRQGRGKTFLNKLFSTSRKL
eukprot:jgi/Ulvmu1/9083/UM005_0178.1